MYGKTILAGLAGLGVFAMGFAAAHADPLLLSGSVSDAGSYSDAQLAGLGNTSETVGGNNFVGVPLWTLLGGTGTGTSDVITGSGKNAILRDYVMATGSNGAQSLISLGEIDPFFGGTGPTPLVAYQENGVALSTPQLVVPQDPTGTRSLANLTGLQVVGVPAPPAGPGTVTSQFTLSGNVTTPGTYNLSSLQSLPPITSTVTFISGKSSKTATYTGAGFFALLQAAGIAQDNILSSYVLATGNDGYQVLFSLAELDPEFGAPDDLLAYADTSGDFSGPGGEELAQVIIPGDSHGGRFVSILSSLQVVDVPEPASGALLLPALAGMIFWRRRLGSD